MDVVHRHQPDRDALLDALRRGRADQQGRVDERPVPGRDHDPHDHVPRRAHGERPVQGHLPAGRGHRLQRPAPGPAARRGRGRGTGASPPAIPMGLRAGMRGSARSASGARAVDGRPTCASADDRGHAPHVGGRLDRGPGAAPLGRQPAVAVDPAPLAQVGVGASPPRGRSSPGRTPPSRRPRRRSGASAGPGRRPRTRPGPRRPARGGGRRPGTPAAGCRPTTWRATGRRATPRPRGRRTAAGRRRRPPPRRGGGPPPPPPTPAPGARPRRRSSRRHRPQA